MHIVAADVHLGSTRAASGVHYDVAPQIRSLRYLIVGQTPAYVAQSSPEWTAGLEATAGFEMTDEQAIAVGQQFQRVWPYEIDADLGDNL